MTMLPTTPGGDAYTYSDYQSLLAAAGFTSSELYDLPPTIFGLSLLRNRYSSMRSVLDTDWE